MFDTEMSVQKAMENFRRYLIINSEDRKLEQQMILQFMESVSSELLKKRKRANTQGEKR